MEICKFRKKKKFSSYRPANVGTFSSSVKNDYFGYVTATQQGFCWLKLRPRWSHPDNVLVHVYRAFTWVTRHILGLLIITSLFCCKKLKWAVYHELNATEKLIFTQLKSKAKIF